MKKINAKTEITQDDVRNTFSYVAETGRLVRVRRGLGARVGVEIGSVSPLNGHRRAYFFGQNRMTAHLVWLWHKGSLPNGILRHENGDNSDDRIENLALLKQQLVVSYSRQGVEVNEYGRLPADIKSGIYEIVCIANGRRYVGSAVSMSARWRLHYTQLSERKHHSRHMQRAWNKHGADTFVFRVLEECNRDRLIDREQYYIDRMTPEFNSAPIAGSQLGMKHTEEVRKKMSESRPKDFSPMTGKRHSDEAKAKISRAKTGVLFGSYSKTRVEKNAAAMRNSKGALTEDQVILIRKMKAAGASHREVSVAVGCTYWVVADVHRRRTFQWVE